MKIGHGFDIHRFEVNKPLMLGGVHIPFDKGMQAHSDGDVVLHALCDALLGAAGLGDIGLHFEDHDPRWKNAPGRDFVRHVFQSLQQRHYVVQNVDITVIAEVPKLRPYTAQMCVHIAADLNIDPDCVNVKATTMEKLGPIGQAEAIAAHAVVLIA